MYLVAGREAWEGLLRVAGYRQDLYTVRSVHAEIASGLAARSPPRILAAP